MLGNALCLYYSSSHTIYAFHRDDKNLIKWDNNYSIDLSNLEVIKKTFYQINPDIVIHCAGLTDVELCEKDPSLAHYVNSTITNNIILACPKKTKLVYISTDQVYGLSYDHLEKNSRIKPINEYGKSKFSGEKQCTRLKSNCIIVRTNIFGWNIKNNRVSSAEWIYHSLKQKKRISLFHDYRFSPIYTKKLAPIIIDLIKLNFRGLINVGSSNSCSKYEFGVALAERFNFDKSLINKTSLDDFVFKAKRPKNLQLNIQKIQKLGIALPSYKDSIKNFMADNTENL